MEVSDKTTKLQKIKAKMSFGPVTNKLWGLMRSAVGKNKKLSLIVGIILLIALIGGGGLLGRHIWNNRNAKKLTSSKQQAPKLSPQAQLVADTSNALNSNQYDKALAAIQASGQADTKDNMILAATIYQAKGDFQKAYEILLESEKKHGLDSGTALNLATVAQQLKNKTAAIDYYKKTLELLQKEHDPNYAQTAKIIQKAIQDLTK